VGKHRKKDENKVPLDSTETLIVTKNNNNTNKETSSNHSKNKMVQ
jgi:hypothetical protein